MTVMLSVAGAIIALFVVKDILSFLLGDATSQQLRHRHAEARQQVVREFSGDGRDGEAVAALMDGIMAKRFAEMNRRVEEFKAEGHTREEIIRFIKQLTP